MPELDRWRLVLGRFAEPEIGAPDSGSDDARRVEALDYLYRRAYAGRGVREIGPGTDGASDPGVVEWLGEIRGLFGTEVAEEIVGHALDRFGLTEIIADPEVLATMPPSEELLRLLLTLRRRLPAAIDLQLRRIITEVVADIRRRLEPELRRVLAGARRSFSHSPMPVAANLDLPGTIRRNLKNFDPEQRRLVISELRFFDRRDRQLPWEIILCVDQSGSMADSIIHAAVTAGIIAGLPSLRIRLVVFDTAVVDLSEHADDPVATLMSVQLGGGTDIGGALRYCGSLVTNPHRTALVLISDFCEGASPVELIRVTTALAESGSRLLGLASLRDSAAEPFYDKAIAGRMADAGMQIAAMTPRRLADWLVTVTS